MTRLAALSLSVVAILGTVSLTADAQPKKKKPAAAEMTDASADFNKEAASTAILGVDLGKCRATNAGKGEGHVTITFTPDGGAQAVQIDKGPWVGTPVAKCMTKEFKKARVPAFKGESITVGKVFHFE